MTKQKPASKSVRRWLASTYRDDSRPSPVFRLTASLGILAWLVMTSFIVARPVTVGSPDESASAYFMSIVARTGQYRLATGLSADMVTLLHPRSMAVQGTALASGSFLGLIQAGAVTIKTFGPGAERAITPLLALFGLLAMYLIFRRFWGRWWALAGAVLIALHPAFFEFATLPYLHNGAFVASLMIAAWACLRLLERPTLAASILFGATFGLALYFRPVEALWTVPAVIVFLLARKLWPQLLVVGLAVVIVQLPWLIANQLVYGSFLSSGYTPYGVFNDAAGTTAVTAPLQTLFTPPGGAWSWHWLSSTWWYYMLLLPAWSAMAVVSIVRYFRRKYVSWAKSIKLSAISLIGIFPLVYYGTWNLYPATPSSDVGALASYVRYWLPLYVLMAPGVIMILRLLARRWLVIGLMALLLVSQAWIIWYHPVSGLRARFAADDKNRVIRESVLRFTESNAVIIAGHADKYFQAERLSAFRLPQSDAEWKVFRSLTAVRPVYLYVAVGAVNTTAAQKNMALYGLQMEQKLTVGRDVLWKITLIS